MNRTASRQREGGFTLIELLVALTLLSLLSLLLFGGLRFGVRAWDGAQAHGEGTDDLLVVQNLIRREVEQAYPAYDATDPTHPTLDFSGDGTSLTFLAPTPEAARSGGRSRITISAEPDGGRTSLVMQAAPELAVDGSWSAPLLRNIARVRFAYFGAGRWRSSWSDTKTLPSLVRISVAFRKGDIRTWPDLVVAPRIQTDAGCIYDVSTHDCRGRS